MGRGYCLSTGVYRDASERVSLHYQVTKTFKDGAEIVATLHNAGELARWLEHVESMEQGDTVAIVAQDRLCPKCAAGQQTGVTFMCHLSD